MATRRRRSPAISVSVGRYHTTTRMPRAWLRAVHRDIGYLAVGFTLIYALSGIAMNHIDDWDPNFHSSEITKKITPVPDDVSDSGEMFTLMNRF